MIVVDTNVIAYLYLPGSATRRAGALFAQDPDWCAPTLWRSEFRNILAGYLRTGTITFEQALRMQREAESLLQGAEYGIDSGTVLELVRDSACSAYDCELVALAMQLDTALVTMDRQLLRTFPNVAVPLPPA